MEPTASLLTAVLVAGAASMTGLAERNGEHLSLYDVNQGFGRVDLSRSLPLSGVTDESWRLQVTPQCWVLTIRPLHSHSLCLSKKYWQAYRLQFAAGMA